MTDLFHLDFQRLTIGSEMPSNEADNVLDVPCSVVVVSADASLTTR